MLIIAFALCFAGCSTEDSQAITPYSSDICEGKDCSDVYYDFYKTGFINISEEIIYDLEISDIKKEGTVKSVSINGITDFDGNTEFNKLSNVVITYHSIKKINVPISSDDAKFMDTEQLSKKFEEAGFDNISIEEKNDLDPDKTDKEFENQIVIDRESSFDTTDTFQANEEVKIIIHKPYEKYNVKVIVTFIPNLFFNRYDVIAELGEETISIEHGEDIEFECKLKPGYHDIVFYSASSEDISGELEIEVKGETEVACEITCDSEEIGVVEEYVINKSEIAADKAIIPISASNCKYKNYKDVEQYFIEAGFSNISTNILYDIVWGWTAEGEVEKVEIDGKTNFNSGETYDKTTPIIITYHMKEEDDPTKPVETSKITTATTTTTTTPTPVYYSTNTRETVSDGDKGIYSYKSDGKFYDIYYIIDFEEGYVYYFLEGEGNDWCERTAIKSGNLNDGLKVIFNYHGDLATYYFHFRHTNHSETLIMVDDDGFKYEYKPTDLDNALKLREKKDIIER